MQEMQSESEYRDTAGNKRGGTWNFETQIGKIQRSSRLQMCLLPQVSYGLKMCEYFP